MRATRQNILTVLESTITTEGTEWSAIVAAVRGKMAIKDWLTVRGVVQWMLDNGRIKRTDDVHREVYVRLPTQTYPLWIQACGPYTVDETLTVARAALGDARVISARPVSETLREMMFTAVITVSGIAAREAAQILDKAELTAWDVEPAIVDTDDDGCDIEPASVLGLERAS